MEKELWENFAGLALQVSTLSARVDGLQLSFFASLGADMPADRADAIRKVFYYEYLDSLKRQETLLLPLLEGFPDLVRSLNEIKETVNQYIDEMNTY